MVSLLLGASTCGFQLAGRVPPVTGARSDARMGLFDGLASAFGNDDSLGERCVSQMCIFCCCDRARVRTRSRRRQEAGLAKKAEYHTITFQAPPEKTFFGEKPGEQIVTKAIAGQKMKEVARAAGVEIPYSCNEVCSANRVHNSASVRVWPVDSSV